ncbi:MAG: GNAT family N-acetyltransferase [Anaerolineales bacterium]|nr:GNAT family N-acetyltransferase [Anaerolineales bacterium]MCB0012243.1 GNAT family N-acetyltransferase [Anaerolineales bacterium]
MALTDDTLTITKGRHELLAEIQPFWYALHDHHVAVAPFKGEPRTQAESWQRRRAEYEGWLAEPRAFFLVARVQGQPAGYAFVRFEERHSATWQAAPEEVELETLAVLPAFRGSGVGTALVDRVRAEALQQGITTLSLIVIASNEGAINFYQAQGFQAHEILMKQHLELSMPTVDRFLGLWEFQPDEARYDLGAPPRAGSYEIIAEGEKLTFVMKWVDQAGESHEMAYSEQCDGQIHPIQAPTADQMSLTLKSDTVLESVAFKDGATVMTASRELLDEATLEVIMGGPLPDGSQYRNRSIYKRSGS